MSVSDPISVLVVDDDEEGRALLLGGGAARESETGIDVVVLDVLMPGIDGLETLKRYRSRGGRKPVVMVSAIDEANTALQAVRLGAFDYVTKPFDGDELREIIERAAEGSGSARGIASPPKVATASRLGESVAMQQVSE